VRLQEFKVSIEPIMSQSLSASPINKVMSMEQIFQDIRLEVSLEDKVYLQIYYHHS
jgi:hypothetical protein